MKARPSEWTRSVARALAWQGAALFCCSPAWAQLAVVHSFTGSVLLERFAAGPWAPLQLAPERLQAGSELRPGPDGAVELRFADKSRVVVEAGSDFTLNDGDKTQDHVSLASGSLRAWIHPSEEPHFYVRTPTAVCTIRGTRFKVEVAKDGATTVQLFEGKLSVADLKGHELLLQAGQVVEVSDVLGTPRPLSAQELRGDRRYPPPSLDSYSYEASPGALSREVSEEGSREQWRQSDGRQIVSGLQPLGASFVDTRSPSPATP